MYRMISFLCVSILILSSCGKEARTNLTVAERKIVNNKYKNQLDSLNKTLIKECKEYKENNFDKIVDSLKRTRLEEIQLITKTKGNG